VRSRGAAIHVEITDADVWAADVASGLMADQGSSEATETYLIELYRPGVRVDALTQMAAGVRDTVTQMQREGEHVAFVSSTIVPRDEYLQCVLQAASELLARDAFTRAGITFERISTAISVKE